MNDTVNLTGLAKQLVLAELLDAKTAQQANLQAQRNQLPLVTYLVQNKLVKGRALVELASDQFGVAYHKQVISAHRTPELMAEFAHNARANGLKVIIAGAGGAAHLPGMIAAQTTLPVIGVPVRSHALSGWDSLLSIVQMPGGIPVATFAIGEAGAVNAALFTVAMLALSDVELAKKLSEFRVSQTEKVLAKTLPDLP